MDEFEIMREQLAAMKQQLDSQHIINESLMRKVMHGKASWMNRFVTAELIALPVIYLLFVGICSVYNISQWFSFAYLILGGLDALLDMRTVRIPNKIFSSSSILNLRKILLRQKRERFIQTCVSGSFCVIWIVSFLYAIGNSTGISNQYKDIFNAGKTGGLIGGIVGAIVGGITVIILYKKMQSTNDTLLLDLKELQQE